MGLCLRQFLALKLFQALTFFLQAGKHFFFDALAFGLEPPDGFLLDAFPLVLQMFARLFLDALSLFVNRLPSFFLLFGPSLSLRLLPDTALFLMPPAFFFQLPGSLFKLLLNFFPRLDANFLFHLPFGFGRGVAPGFFIKRGTLGIEPVSPPLLFRLASRAFFTGTAKCQLFCLMVTCRRNLGKGVGFGSGEGGACTGDFWDSSCLESLCSIACLTRS